ncbi:hypothetical protein [Magnetospira sp. QH-2]|uniref:hypothetical protein n=1 Tax=Magnetospira sp. (strain QH-2) TaxID=1288970 RepID=UPI0003E80ED7|nr:hypothetical protein [Magnetospira sp. QH-2]CCQ73924.1 Protein of unknown function [Magnetospira sp. QH-2]
MAKEFIHLNSDHTGIVKACELLQGMTRHAVCSDSLPSHASPKQRADRWLSRMREQGIDPKDMLAVVLSVHLLRKFSPGTFQDTQHFNHQLTRRLFEIVRPRSKLSTTGKSILYDTVTPKIRDYMTERLKPLDLLLHRMVDEIDSRQPKLIEGSENPFLN